MLAPQISQSPKLIRGLGLTASMAVIMGGMIGQSIFLVTSQVTRELASERRVFAAWLIGGAIVTLSTFCYSELSAALPEAGGDYIYLARGLGPRWGFLFGWTSAWIQGPGIAATVAAGLMRLMGFMNPAVRLPLISWNVVVPLIHRRFHFGLHGTHVGAALALILVGTVNYLGIRSAGKLQVAVTSLKVMAMLSIVVLGFLLNKAVSPTSELTPELPVSSQGTFGATLAFVSALVPIMLAYNGFQALAHLGGEIREPGRIIPLAAILGVLGVVTLYVLVNAVYFRTLSISAITHSQNVASDAVIQLVGPSGARWLTLIMILSAFGSLHVNFMARARIPYAMARDGQFFGFVKHIHPKFGSPSGALLFHGGLAVAIVLTGTFEEIYSLEIFSIYLFLALTAIALMRLRVKEPLLQRPYRAWGYPVTPLLVAGASFAISINLWLTRPIRSSIGVAVVLLGLPVFHYLQHRSLAGELPERAAADF